MRPHRPARRGNDQVLAVPDETATRAKIADWLEFKALSSAEGRVPFGTLVSATSLTEEEDNRDIADDDAQNEELVLRAQDEIERRRKNVGDDYPFRIDERGRVLELQAPLSRAGYVYLFCLFLSHAFDRAIVPKELAPNVTNAIRDLFQACSTVAAGGFVQGPAVSFGVPRPDGAAFLKSLRRVYKMIGDGRPCKKPRKAAPPNVQDNGIDVIAWRPAVDGLAGGQYLVGQVASGKDWVDKSVIPDREQFHKYWFVEQPAANTIDAMFVPFGLEPDNEKQEEDYPALLQDYNARLMYKYGVLFYRDRIAAYAAIGLNLVAAGEARIERHGEIARVVHWVDDYRNKLQTA